MAALRLKAWWAIILGVLALLVAGGGLGAWFVWESHQRFLVTPLSLPREPVLWRLAPGTSYRAMVRDLAARGYTTADWRWRLLGRLDPRPGRLEAGEYALEPGITPLELLRKLAAGEVHLHAFTIVEGWTVRELRLQLAEAVGIERTADDLAPAALAAALGMDTESPEGWFLPETYRYPSGTTDRQLLGEAYGAMKALLERSWEERPEGLPYASPYEVLTMASIVEKETGRSEERARIAGVFVRRLERGMRLQTDPTVIYGIGEGFNGNLTRRDLRRDTPWNTYTRHGLPPTPIALPGQAAIEAALAPEPGDALFFVSRGDGTHVFSATLAEHEAAVDHYQRGR